MPHEQLEPTTLAFFATVKRILIKTARITWNVLTISEAAEDYPDAVYSMIWHHLPTTTRSSRLGYAFGRFINRRCRLRQKRERCEYTRFLRVRPQLEVAQNVVSQMPHGAPVGIAVLGCSTGAELYSFLWAIRSVRPDLKIVPVGVDISSSALDIAGAGLYSCNAREVEGLSEQEVDSLFTRDRGSLKVRDWIVEGVTWINADASDPGLRDIIGYQNIVVANNFLIHMYPPEDEAALRAIIKLLDPGGYLITHGVNIDVRTRVAHDLGLIPVRFRIEEQHNTMDPQNLPTWPFHWSSREPLDKRLPNWEARYATVFQIPRQAHNAA